MPPCWLHGTIANPSQWLYDPIHKTTNLEEFQKLLQTSEKTYRTKVEYLFNVVRTKGEPFLKVLFNTYFYRQLMKPAHTQRFIKYTLPGHYFMECLKAGYTEATNILRSWPSVRLCLEKGLPASEIQCISKASPPQRDEFRKPIMAPSLNRYQKDHDYDRYSHCMWKHYGHPCPCKKLAGDYAKTLCDYNLALFAFWAHVKGKLRAWKTTHGFRSTQSFVPSTDSLAQLILRNPRRVPNAKEEFARAVNQASNDPIEEPYVKTPSWKIWLTWLGTEGHSNVQASAVSIYVCSNACIELAKLFGNPQEYALSNTFLLWATRRLKSFPLENEDAKEICDILLDTLYYPSNIHTGVMCKMLEALGHLSHVSQETQQKLVSIITGSTEMANYMRNDVHLRNTIVRYCLREMDCVCIANSPPIAYPNEEILRDTPLLQSRVRFIRDKACWRLAGFLQMARRILLARKQARIRLLELHAHAWQTLVIRFRYLNTRLLNQECPVCMEGGTAKVVLHGERRHFTCQDCYQQVSQTNRCPLCRTSLRTPAQNYQDDYYDYYDDHEIYGAYDEYEERLEAFRDEMRHHSRW